MVQVADGIFLFTIRSKWVLSLMHPPRRHFPKVIFEADHSSPCESEVQDVWEWVSIPLYVFLTRCSFQYRHIFAFCTSLLVNKFFLSCLCLQDYVHDRNVQRTKKEKKNLHQTEDWTNGGFADKHVSRNWEWNTCFLVWWRAGLACVGSSIFSVFLPKSVPLTEAKHCLSWPTWLQVASAGQHLCHYPIHQK